jgi:hypothetical protein
MGYRIDHHFFSFLCLKTTLCFYIDSKLKAEIVKRKRRRKSCPSDRKSTSDIKHTSDKKSSHIDRKFCPGDERLYLSDNKSCPVDSKLSPRDSKFCCRDINNCPSDKKYGPKIENTVSSNVSYLFI